MLDVYFLNPFVYSWKLLSCMWDSWSWWENHLHFLSPFAKMGGTMKQLCHVWFLKLQLLKQTFQWVIKSSCPHFGWHWSFYSPCYRQPCWLLPCWNTFLVLQPRKEGPKCKCTLLFCKSFSSSSNVFALSQNWRHQKCFVYLFAFWRTYGSILLPLKH